MKKYIIALLCLSSLTYTAPYTSTENALKDIMNVCGPIISSDNIFKHPNMLMQLRGLGERLNSYVMNKQGILTGKVSKGDNVESDNIFDVWSKGLYNRFLTLVQLLQNIKLSGKQASIMQLEQWKKAETFKNEVTEKANKILNNTLLDQKKKAATITILFAEHIVDIIKKALEDYKAM